MIRSEIKKFTMSYEKCGELPCVAPCTLFSVLKENKIFEYPMNEGEAAAWQSYFDSPCQFFSTFDMTDLDIKRKYIYLRFYSVSGGADLLLNGEKIACFDNSQRIYTVDIKGRCRAGENEIRLIFHPDELSDMTARRLNLEHGLGLSDVGISGKVELLKFNNAIIDNVSLTETVNDGTATVNIRLETLGNADSVKAVATLVSGSGQMYYGGIVRGQGSIAVRNPLYWWPHGLGVQNIYRLTVNLYGEHDIEDTREYSIGIGNLGINREPSGALALANGTSFIPMGLYYTPQDEIYAGEKTEKTNALVMAAVRANCNTLVISGASGFASDALLSACDIYGITLWQELPPIVEGQNPDSYLAGLMSSIKRISYHPCLAALIDTAGDGADLGVELLCKNAAPDISFMTKEEYEKIDVASCTALPKDDTITAFAGKDPNLFSREMDWHSGDNMAKMLLYTATKYLYAADTSSFGYLTRLVQAEMMTDFIRGARVNRSFGGAAIISRLTDSRPTISDSMVDCFCRPKALQNYAARAFAPTVIIPKLEDGQISFAISNERRTAFEGELYYNVCDAQNNLIFTDSFGVSVSESSVFAFEGKDLTDVISGHEHEYYLQYGIREGALPVSCGTMLFTLPKRFAFVDPEIKAQISGAGRSLTMTIKAEAFAKDVEISFDGHDVLISDNCFDITSSAPIKLNLTVIGDTATPFELEESMRIKCVNTIGNVNKSLKKDRFEAKKEELLEKLNLNLF